MSAGRRRTFLRRYVTLHTCCAFGVADDDDDVGRPLFAEYTPVTDFWEGVCKQLEKDGVCSRGPNCNFMHLKKIGRTLEKEMCTCARARLRVTVWRRVSQIPKVESQCTARAVLRCSSSCSRCVVVCALGVRSGVKGCVAWLRGAH